MSENANVLHKNDSDDWKYVRTKYGAAYTFKLDTVWRFLPIFRI